MPFAVDVSEGTPSSALSRAWIVAVEGIGVTRSHARKTSAHCTLSSQKKYSQPEVYGRQQNCGTHSECRALQNTVRKLNRWDHDGMQR